jgi:hypothetical protein
VTSSDSSLPHESALAQSDTVGLSAPPAKCNLGPAGYTRLGAYSCALPQPLSALGIRHHQAVNCFQGRALPSWGHRAISQQPADSGIMPPPAQWVGQCACSPCRGWACPYLLPWVCTSVPSRCTSGMNGWVCCLSEAAPPATSLRCLAFRPIPVRLRFSLGITYN